MDPSKENRHRGNNLDLLRLAFASLVLLSHAPELLDGDRSRELLSQLPGGAETFGGFAVSGFFALSGYLIMASWRRLPKLEPYFKNRVLRICPGFIVAFCVSVLIVGPVAAGDAATYFQQFSASRFLFSMLTLREPWFAQSFPSLPHHDVNGAMWTISYEFACYIAVAMIGLLAGRYLKAVWLLITFVLLIGACFLPELDQLPQINRFWVASLVKMGSVFFAGGSLCLLEFEGLASITSMIVAAVLLAVSILSIRTSTVGFAIFGSAFFLSLGSRAPKIRMTRNWPDISYGTYLYGWPILQLLIWRCAYLGPWIIFVLSLVLSLACGFLSWTLVEAPFMRLKRAARARESAGAG